MIARTEEIEAVVGSKLIPTSVTVEIARRSRSRLRGRETVRVALTYSLERSEEEAWDAVNLARHIRRSMRLTRNAYGLARTSTSQRPPVSLHVATEVAAIPSAVQEPANGLVSASVPTSNSGDEIEPDKETTRMALARDNAPISNAALLQSGKTKEVKAPRKLTETQHKTLEIMARQLEIKGQGLIDLLGLRCNKTRLQDLTYREAAGLIAQFSSQLRLRLLKEKENEAKAVNANIQGEGNLSQGA